VLETSATRPIWKIRCPRIREGRVAVGFVFRLPDKFCDLQGVTGGRPAFNVGWDDGKVLRDLLDADSR
jgi:hypothetical protein